MGHSNEDQQNLPPQRGQLQYPLDAESEATLRFALENVEKDVIRKRNRVVLSLDTTRVTFNVASDYMVLSGDSTVVLATIGGGREGQILTLEFTDSHINIANDCTGAANTVNLAGSANFVSTADDVLQLLHNGISFREVSRSIN